jgi:hypothetical protein
MKFTVYFERDSKQTLWVDTLNANESVPEDLRGKLYVMNEHAFDDTIPCFMKQSFTAEMPSYDFRAIFAEKAIKVRSTKKEG